MLQLHSALKAAASLGVLCGFAWGHGGIFWGRGNGIGISSVGNGMKNHVCYANTH